MKTKKHIVFLKLASDDELGRKLQDLLNIPAAQIRVMETAFNKVK